MFIIATGNNSASSPLRVHKSLRENCFQFKTSKNSTQFDSKNMSKQMCQGDVADNSLESPISSKDQGKMFQCAAMEPNNHFQVLSRLPMDVRKRLRALRKLQIQSNGIEMELNQKVFELEKEFNAKHQEIFKKRFEIITGRYEPNDEECDVPDPEILKSIDENAEEFAKLKQQDHPDNDNSDLPATGVPQFWFHILYSNPTFDYLIHKDDEPILKHLIDIRTTYKLEPHCSFTLELEFSPNPFFENLVLTKEYLLKMSSDDIISYEGPSIYKTIGCDILWKTEKMLRPSIFDFFNPPLLPEDVSDPSYAEIKNVLEDDFEIGDYLKDSIVPKAVLYFTGERDDADLEESIETDGEGSLLSNSDVGDQLEDEKLLSIL